MLLTGLTFGYTAANAKNKTKTMEIKIVETSDVHGSFFPYDFIRRKPKAGSLARVSILSLVIGLILAITGYGEASYVCAAIFGVSFTAFLPASW